MKNFLAGLVIGAAVAALGFALKDYGAQSASSPLLGSVTDGKEVRCGAGQLQHNRQLVQRFFAPDRSPTEAYNSMVPSYVQHNEGVKRFGKLNGLADREAFKAIDEILTKSALRPELMAEPGRPKNEMAFKIIATCDHVVAMHRTYVPDPQQTGSYYPAFDYELWRIEDGKFAEHWDSQRIPTPLPDLMRAPVKN